MVNEFGDNEGIVTLADVFQTVAGDMMPGADDPALALAVQREDGSWLLDGMLPLDEMWERLGVQDLHSDPSGLYHTVGGFVVARMGKSRAGRKNSASVTGSSRWWIWITTGSTKSWQPAASHRSHEKSGPENKGAAETCCRNVANAAPNG